MVAIRRNWSGVLGVVAVNPIVTQQHSTTEELNDSVPEVSFLQPRRVLRAVVMTGSSYLRKDFARELGAAIGSVARPDKDLEPVFAVFKEYLGRRPPVYFEDDPSGMGACTICGKRGAFGRCTSCGLLSHLTCLAPERPGREPQCPRCASAPKTLDGVDSSKVGLARRRFKAGALAPAAVGLERGLDARVPCPLDRRPTDEEAQSHGFVDAEDWYTWSASGALVHPRVIKENFESLNSKDPSKDELDQAVMQGWKIQKGEAPKELGLDASGAPDGALALFQGSGAEGRNSEECDQTAAVADALKMSHPYLMLDVEILERDRIQDLREKLAQKCKEVWLKDAKGEGTEELPLPVPEAIAEQPYGYQPADVRREHVACQKADPELGRIIAQKTAELDPYSHSKKKTGKALEAPLKPVVAALYRLSPLGGVLEHQVILAVAALCVPVIPVGNMPLLTEPQPWRKWLFGQAHLTFANPHRPYPETVRILKRMAYWDTLAGDAEKWWAQCDVCVRHRSHPVRSRPYGAC